MYAARRFHCSCTNLPSWSSLALSIASESSTQMETLNSRITDRWTLNRICHDSILPSSSTGLDWWKWSMLHKWMKQIFIIFVIFKISSVLNVRLLCLITKTSLTEQMTAGLHTTMYCSFDNLPYHSRSDRKFAFKNKTSQRVKSILICSSLKKNHLASCKNM